MPKETNSPPPPSIGRHADLATRFPRASAAFLRLNQAGQTPAAPVSPRPTAAALHADSVPAPCQPPSPKPQRRARARPLAAPKTEAGDTRFFVVRFTSVRSRLADPDNLVEKWHIDALRYAGILPDDNAATIRLETSQRKTREGEEEHTQIEVEITTPPPAP